MRDEKGFTLVEVVAAIIIIGIGFLPMYALFEQGLRNTVDTNTQFVANELAEQTIEYMKGVSYANLVVQDEDFTDGGKVTFKANATNCKLPITIPDKWSVDVTLSETAFTDNTASYGLDNEMIHVQQVKLDDGTPYFLINGELHQVAHAGGHTFPQLTIHVNKVTGGYVTTLKACGRDLYKLKTSKEPRCYVYYETRQDILAEKHNIKNNPLRLTMIKQGTESITFNVMPNNPSNEAYIKPEYYYMCTQTMDATMQDVTVVATDNEVIFKRMGGELSRYNLTTKDTEIGGEVKPTAHVEYKPIINLLAPTLTAEKEVKVYNHCIAPLDIEVTSDDLIYTIEKGIINKRYYSAQAQTSNNILYACEVEVFDDTNTSRVKIITTKKE